MKECGKAVFRRLAEPAFLTRYFVGRGLDVGSGDDPLTLYTQLFPQISAVQAWDLESGDAQYLKGVADESYDFVHSSHCLEHMVDPAMALASWFRAVRPGGHLILLVPDEDLYEQGVWPSSFNGDHKHTFTIAKDRSWSPVSINLMDLLRRLGPAAEIRKLALLEATFRENLPRFDQTLTVIGESAIEVVIRKRLRREIDDGGRTPPAGDIAPEQRGLLEIPAASIDPAPLFERMSQVQGRLQQAELERETLRAELRNLRASTSWRITEPVRRLVQALRGLRRRS
jgi:SAM-dependent methyltransferase